MKKLLCAILALITVVSLAACSKDPDPTNTDVTTKAPSAYTWPDNVLFKDVPALKDTISFYNETKDENGYVYTLFADDITYDEFCDYIDKLEKAEFNIYDTTGLNITTTDDILPDSLPEGKHNASWLGKRRGLYIAANWYGDEFYEENGLPKDSNVRIYFYTYDAFKK